MPRYQVIIICPHQVGVVMTKSGYAMTLAKHSPLSPFTYIPITAYNDIDPTHAPGDKPPTRGRTVPPIVLPLPSHCSTITLKSSTQDLWSSRSREFSHVCGPARPDRLGLNNYNNHHLHVRQGSLLFPIFLVLIFVLSQWSALYCPRPPSHPTYPLSVPHPPSTCGVRECVSGAREWCTRVREYAACGLFVGLREGSRGKL